MKTVLAYKTETNGLPDWRGRSDAPNQPHLVRLAAILFNAETKEPIEQFDVIVRPDGWKIPEVTVKSHGITEEHAAEVGIDESSAVELLFKLLAEAGDDVIRVTSNKQFNSRVVRIAAKRFATEAQQEIWSEKENHVCATTMAKNHFNVQRITIDDAISHFTNDEICAGSLGDATKAAKVFFAING